MTPEFAYFLKVNVALALFYAFYRLFFYKDTFFKLRRAILLIFFGLAIVYPLLNVRQWMSEQEPLAGAIQIYSAILPEANIYAEAEASVSNIIPAIYLAVVAVFLLRFFVQLGSLFWLAFRSKREVIGDTNVYVYVLDKPAGPFSFFGLIFIHPASHSEKEIEEILAHESTHASQGHSVDIIVSELICIACWINPFVWLLKREVRHNLEYLADNRVIESGFDSQSYQYHLLGLAHNHQAAANIYNNFNVLHLKNRIRMMNKKRSRAIGRTKYLMFIPLTALLMLLSNIVACTEEKKPKALSSEPESAVMFDVKAESQTQPDDRVIFTIVENMPKFPGGDDGLLKFLQTETKYPKEAQDKGLEGRVVARFIVNEDGSISGAEVIRGVDPLLDAEALRVIKAMPKWEPGKQNGKAVNVQYTLPVTFQLSAVSEISQKTQSVNSEVDANGAYNVVEEMPEFPGGNNELMKYLTSSIKYPAEAVESAFQGRVVVSFIVNKDGSISDIKVLRGVASALDKEAIRVVSAMPKWIPGKMKGEAVRVKYTLPVTFKL
jgi:TonB family protein